MEPDNLEAVPRWMDGNLTEKYYIAYYQRPESYIVPVVFAVIFIVGVLGNGTLVFIFARHKRMRNIPNTYIFSLALGDLLMILSCVPFAFLLYTLQSWPWGELICKLYETTKAVSIGVSVFTLTALSAERYCAIVKPTRGNISTKPLTTLTTLAIWLFSLILALPTAIISNIQNVFTPDSIVKYCSNVPQERTFEKEIVMFKFLVYYAIPLCAITVFYILMARHLALSNKNLPGKHEEGQKKEIHIQEDVAKVVLAYVRIFVFCLLPNYIFVLWFYFYPYSKDVYDEFWNVFSIVAFCLGYMSFCIKPIALYFLSHDFRKYFNRYLLCFLHDETRSDVTMVQVNSSSYRWQNSVLTSHYSLSHTEKS